MSDHNQPTNEESKTDRHQTGSITSNNINTNNTATAQHQITAGNPTNSNSGWWKIGWDRWLELLFTLAIMGATVVNVCVANRQWSAMLESNKINRDMEQRQLRAYVGIPNEDIILNCIACEQPNKIVPADLYSDENMLILPVENYGQTPAFDGRAIAGGKDMPVGQELPSNFSYPLGDASQRTPLKVSPWTAEPHEITHGGITMDATNIDRIKRARDHQIWLYFYGQVTYVDVFGCKAKTLFCFRYIPDNDPKHRFAMCPEHNEPAKNCEKQREPD